MQKLAWSAADKLNRLSRTHSIVANDTLGRAKHACKCNKATAASQSAATSQQAGTLHRCSAVCDGVTDSPNAEAMQSFDSTYMAATRRHHQGHHHQMSEGIHRCPHNHHCQECHTTNLCAYNYALPVSAESRFLHNTHFVAFLKFASFTQSGVMVIMA